MVADGTLGVPFLFVVRINGVNLMQKKQFMDAYPIFELTLDKAGSRFAHAADIIAELQANIAAHPIAKFIAIFDHYEHTTQTLKGEVEAGMLDAQNIIFCFGTKIPNAQVLAVRPRSIGVVEYADRFVVSFLEPPMPVATEAMVAWVTALQS